MDWSAFEWTADGTLQTSEGLIDALVVGGGGKNTNWFANSGGAKGNLLQVGGAYDIVVGAGGYPTQGSRIGDADPTVTQLLVCTASVYGSGNPLPSDNTSNDQIWDGTPSAITGELIDYARGAYPPDKSNMPGCAINTSVNPTPNDGVVVIRVPRSNDKTGVLSGEFNTTTLRDKATSAAKQKIKNRKAKK
jgi:hypothetical protein